MLKRRLKIKIKSLDGATYANDEEMTAEYYDLLTQHPEFKSLMEKNMAQCHFQEIDSIIPTLYLGEI